jgi:putative nucleotidyltransferase with HDIG domain
VSADKPATREAPGRISSLPTLITVSSVCLLAVALLVVSWVWTGPPTDWAALVVLTLLGVASWVFRETDGGARVQFSFASIIMLTAAVVLGPVGAGIVGLMSTVVHLGRERVIVRIFNFGMFTCIATIGALVYAVTGGAERGEGMIGPWALIVHVGIPLILADVAQCLTNALTLALILRVAGGVPLRMQAWKLLSTTGLAYVGYGLIGFLFVVLWIPAKVGWFSAVLVLAPLFVARWAFVQYGDEVRAHERTLRALVSAVETKDPHNAGHSERVARLSEWLAEVMGLGHREIQYVRVAGMLHDIGKVAVPTPLLRPRRDLTDDEIVVLAGHAEGGVALVPDIDFLAGAVDGIAYHHERFDGRGYPEGLAGEAIPLFARIVAVADSFDCLTTDRVYRPAVAVDEARRLVTERAGTQFDPVVVEALGRVLARHDWTTTERTPDQLATAGVALDHDELEASDYLAERPELRARLSHPGRQFAVNGVVAL